MGMLLLLFPLAAVAAPFMFVADLFESIFTTSSDIITIWTNFFLK